MSKLPGCNEQPQGSVAPAPNRLCDLFSTTSETRASETMKCREAQGRIRTKQQGSPEPGVPVLEDRPRPFHSMLVNCLRVMIERACPCLTPWRISAAIT